MIKINVSNFTIFKKKRRIISDMIFYERSVYFWVFLMNHYFSCLEFWLNWFENKMIRKYVSSGEIYPKAIPTIQSDDLTNELFCKLSDNFRNPVVIRGYMKDTTAVKMWDKDYLTKKIGDYELMILRKEENVKLEMMKFKEFTYKMEDEDIYINNNNTLLCAFPEIYNDIKERFTSFIGSLETNLRNIHIANVFMGFNKDKVMGSNMHCGGSGNFFCMIKGEKRWTLIDPKYSCVLKGRAAESGIHAQTLFDMPDTDLGTYPKMLTRLPRYEVTLEPGDILWNAPWWWHRIENGNGLSIGLAIRNNKVTKLNLQNNLMYTLSGYTYLWYNTYVIGLYERCMLSKDDHFSNSKEKEDVLYQIEKLVKRYPKTIKLEDIIDIDPKDR